MLMDELSYRKNFTTPRLIKISQNKSCGNPINWKQGVKTFDPLRIRLKLGEINSNRLPLLFNIINFCLMSSGMFRKLNSIAWLFQF